MHKELENGVEIFPVLKQKRASKFFH